MRSPLPTPGRNPLFERIWQTLANFTRTLAPGTQRPLAINTVSGGDATAMGRLYDLEITEYPVRNAHKAHHIIEMCEYCPEIATAINIIADDVFSSEDGDDYGFAVSDTLNDNTTLIDPGVYKILTRLVEEVLGGIALEQAVERMLSYGDAFASIGVNTRTRHIEKLLFLPTWEMFRVENNSGQLLGFEQRHTLTDTNPWAFHPLTVCHWRYRRKNLYGRGLFNESLDDWKNLRAATEDLAAASRAIGVNPNLHIMPECADDSYRKTYKDKYEERKAQGIVTDFYLMQGADIRKLSTVNPDLEALAENVLMWRTRIVMKSRVPPWLLSLPTIGAREIAGQPALAYARFINRVRMTLSDGIRHLCNLELALNGYSKEQWRYRLIWPKIYVNPYEQDALEPGESNAGTIEDSDGGLLINARPRNLPPGRTITTN